MIGCFAAFLAAVAACLISGQSLLWALLLGLGLFFALGLHRGYGAKMLADCAWKKGRESLVVIPVFLLIGTVTALWRSAGTISFFLYYGLNGISPPLFVLMAFVLTAALSFALGTSYGVTGTAGVVLITLARSGNVNVALAAGAILSGAYFGDRCSPMSSCASLVAVSTGTELYRNVGEMLKTAALPTGLSLLFYGWLSWRNPLNHLDTGVLSALSEQFSLHWVTLLPAALMLALSLFRVQVKWSMAVSAGTALILTMTLQGLPLGETLRTALLGYAPADPALAAVLSGGGLMSMAASSAVVFITSLYAGILEGMDALTPAKHWVERLADRVGLFPATTLVSTAIVMVFCNQSVMVLMDEQLLSASYEKRGASRLERAMDISNSGVTIAGLVPWSIALTIPLGMLGADLGAVPYAALLYLIPLCYLFTKPLFRPGQNPAKQAERAGSV
ncbi:MAG: Na+/H+ antiporter NhaC family protein [Oscillibacter sp.]